MCLLDAVRNLEIAPRNGYYFVGEYINCTAEGNPEPQVKWEPDYSAGARPVVDGYLEITCKGALTVPVCILRAHCVSLIVLC